MFNNLTKNEWVIFTYLWFAVLPGFGQGLASLPADYSPTNLQYQDEQTTTLESLLIAYEKKYRVSIIFNSAEIGQQKVNKPTDGPTLDSSLKGLLSPIGLTFKKIDDNVYVVKQAKKRQKSVKKVEHSRTILSANPPPARVKRLSSKAQSYELRVAQTIQGKVTDSDTNEPLPGVNILAKGTTTGTVSDVDGNYRLTVADEVTTLVFSSIGYITIEEEINGRSAIDISLAPDIQSLSEVVVVGYGTQKRKDITGSLSSVKSEELEKIVTPSVDQALQGQTPGLFVANSAGGAPGAAPTVRIRGSNSINSSNEPLYVIDGFPVYPNNGQIRGSGDFRTDQLSPNTSNILATINPNDIESIEVLKDASATAIYGSRGANGVIVITTKRGKNKRSNLNLDWYSGVSTITERLPLMNAGQYAGLLNDYNATFDVPPVFTEEEVRNFEQNGGTDWQDQIFRNALVHNFQLSSNGGNESTQHYLAANYYNEEGIIKGNNIQRFSLRANLDVAPSPKLKLGNSFTTSYTIENAVPNGGRDPATGPGVLISVLNFPPTDPVFNDDGSYNVFPSRSSAAIANPLAIVETQEIQYKSLRSLGTFFVDYEFLPGLTGRVNVGYDVLSRSESAYYPQETTLLGSEVGGAARRINIFDVTWLTDFLLTYNKSFGKHQINAVTGFTAQANTLERTLAARNNFVTDAFGTANLSGGALEVVPQSSLDEWSLVSWLGRVNYILSDRYLLTFSGRYDGSSRFAEGNKFGFFPSGAVAWRVSNEPFLQNSQIVNDLKLRASYGVTGNQEIGLYRSLARYVTVGEIFGGTPAVGVRPASNGIPNEDLTWETTRQLDIGFDLTAFDNRLNFTFDYYHKTTEDLILEFPVTVESGFSSVLQNSGSVENRGIELSGGTSLQVGQVGISFDANVTFNDNNILDLGGQDTIILGNSGRAHIIGRDLGALYVAEFAGIWQLGEEAEAAEYGREPGDPKFVDVNQDGVYDLVNDRRVVGVTQPTTFYGFTTAFNYKNFDLSIFFQGAAGNLASGGTLNGGFGGQSNAFVSALNHWTSENPSNRVPSFTSQDPLLNSNVVPPSRNFEPADYLRLRNVTLAYNLPSETLSRWGLSKLRVYLSGQNLLTFTNYSGQDPEGNGSSYPFARNYRVGLNIGF